MADYSQLRSIDASKIRKDLRRRYNLKLDEFVELNGIVGQYVATQADKTLKALDPYVNILILPAEPNSAPVKKVDNFIEYQGRKIPLVAYVVNTASDDGSADEQTGQKQKAAGSIAR